MRIELVLKNYRCFPDSSPARLVIEDDVWTGLLGVNNAGKSALLRFFYEFRPFFNSLCNPTFWQNLGRNSTLAPGFGTSVRDQKEVFHNQNNRPLSVELRVSAWSPDPPSSGPSPSSVTFEFLRERPGVVRISKFEWRGSNYFPFRNDIQVVNDHFQANNGAQADLRPYLAAALRLSTVLYVGAFRNVLNTGAHLALQRGFPESR